MVATWQIHLSQPTYWGMWHKGKMWPCSDNVVKRRPVGTGWLLLGVLLQLRHKHQFKSRYEIHLINTRGRPVNFQLYGGKLECWATVSFSHIYITWIKHKRPILICSQCIFLTSITKDSWSWGRMFLLMHSTTMMILSTMCLGHLLIYKLSEVKLYTAYFQRGGYFLNLT
jgi:hypothetical protein